MSIRLRSAGLAFAALLALLVVLAPEAVPADGKKKTPAGEFTLSGPYQHDNLTVFLIHGKDRVKPGSLLTLEEALEQNKVVVHETGAVSQLEIENVAEDVEVFIQSGDIVKGGKQDRLLSFDLVLGPKSGKVPVVSLCVESGRWQQRGKEAAARFTSSTGQLPSKELKLQGGNYGQFGALGGQGFGQFGNMGQRVGNGTNLGQFGQFGNQFGQFGQFGQLGGQFGLAGGGGQFGAQGGVWTSVGQLQGRLKEKLGEEVKGKESESSLQLTLEHPRVKEATEKYTRELTKAPEGHRDVIGYAFAVNGKMNSVEVYGSAELFAKLWPKLLKANALEAFLEQEKGKSYPAVKANAVQAVLRDAERGKSVEKEVSKRVRVLMRETEKNVLFETRDREKGTWLHRSYITK